MKRRTFLNVFTVSTLSILGLNQWLKEPIKPTDKTPDPSKTGGMFAHTLNEDFYIKNR